MTQILGKLNTALIFEEKFILMQKIFYWKQRTQLSVLKVKLADRYENGTRSNAATAPASLFFNIASDAEDEGTSETE